MPAICGCASPAPRRRGWPISTRGTSSPATAGGSCRSKVARQRRLVSRQPGGQRPVSPGGLAAGSADHARAQSGLLPSRLPAARPGGLPRRARGQQPAHPAAGRRRRLHRPRARRRGAAHRRQPEHPSRELLGPPVQLHPLEPRAADVRRGRGPPGAHPGDRPAEDRRHALVRLRPASPARRSSPRSGRIAPTPGPGPTTRRAPPSCWRRWAGGTTTATEFSSATAGASASSC